jgi:hypothetical protein
VTPALPEELARRYTAGEELGRGGMGVVFRAVQRGLDRAVAIKVLAGDDLTAEDRARFQQEGRAAARLAHPNLVQVIEAGLEGETLYIVYELVEGGSMRGLLKYERMLAPARALALAAQIADGVGEAHRAGLIHRDLKPENVLLGPGEIAKVTDFGVVKLIDGSGLQTKTGILMGTPNYMSPEQVREEPIDGGVDVYALGVMLYEMLTGELPFTGKPMDVLIAHVQKPVPELPARLPVGVRALVARMLAKQPADRPAGMAEVAELARRLIATDAGDAPRVRRTKTIAARSTVQTAALSRPPLDASNATVASAAPRAPVPTLVIALLTFAAGVGVTIALLPRKDRAVRSPASAAAPPSVVATLPPPPPLPAAPASPRPSPRRPRAFGLGGLFKDIAGLERPARPRAPPPALPSYFPPPPPIGVPPPLPGLPPAATPVVRPPEFTPVGPPVAPPDIPLVPGGPPPEGVETQPWEMTAAEKRLASTDPEFREAVTSPTRRMLATRAARFKSQGRTAAALALVDRLLMWTLVDSAKVGPVEEVTSGDEWVDRLVHHAPGLLHGDAAAMYRELHDALLAYDPPEAEGHAPRFLAHVAMLLALERGADIAGSERLAQNHAAAFLRARATDDPWYYAAALLVAETTYRLGTERLPEVDAVVSQEPPGPLVPGAVAFRPIHKRLQDHLDALEKK